MKKLWAFFLIICFLFVNGKLIEVKAVDSAVYQNPMNEISGVKKFYQNNSYNLIIDTNDNLWSVGSMFTDDVDHKYPIKENVPVFIDSNVSEVFSTSYLKNDGTFYQIGQPGVPFLRNITKVFSAYSTGFALDSNNDLWMWGSNDNYGNKYVLDLDLYIVDPVIIASNVSSLIQTYSGIFIIDTSNNLNYLYNTNSQEFLYANVKDAYNNYLLTNSGDVVKFDFDGTSKVILQNIADISFGTYVNFALSETNELYSWGYNIYGTIGNGLADDSSIETPFKVLSNVEAILVNSYNVAFVRKIDKSLWGWGSNDNSIIGVGNGITAFTPAQILDNVETVVSKSFTTIALKYDQTMWAWGDQTFASLYFASDLADTGIPFSLTSGIEDVYFDSDGFNPTYAKKIDGNVVVWGEGTIGVGDIGFYQYLDNPYAEKTFLSSTGVTSTYDASLAISDTDVYSLQISQNPSVDILIYSGSFSGVEIYRSMDNLNFEFIGIGKSSGSWDTNYQFNDYNVFSDTTYYYSFRPYVADYSSGYSRTVGDYVAIGSIHVPLQRPEVYLAIRDDGKVRINWNALTGASGYEIDYFDTSLGVYGEWVNISDTTNTEFVTVFSIPEINRYYQFRVRGYISTQSGKEYGIYGSNYEYANYSNLNAWGIQINRNSSSSYTITWDKYYLADYYELYYDELLIYTGTTRSFEQSISSITDYSYGNIMVKAYYQNGAVLESGSVSAYVVLNEYIYQFNVTVASSTTLFLDWADSISEYWFRYYPINYSVYRSTSADLSNSSLVYSGTTSEYLDTVASTGTVYYYYVVSQSQDSYNYGMYVYSKITPSIQLVNPVLTVPTNYTVKSQAYNAISLNWDAMNDAIGYEIYRSTTATGSYTLVASPAMTSYTNTGLTFNTTYYYKVRAYAFAGATKVYGSFTSVVSAKTTLNTPVITPVSSGYDRITVSWPAVTGISGYEVYQSTSSAGVYTLLISTAATSYTKTALLTNTNYFYKVRAYRLVGTVRVYSSYSTIQSARPVPSVPVATASSASYNSVKVAWAAIAGATGYEVSYAKTIDGVYTVLPLQAAVTYTLAGQTTNELVYFKVRAYRLVGTTKVFGNSSSIVSAKPIPSTPVLTVASDNYNRLKISWAAIAGASGYELYVLNPTSGLYELLNEGTALLYLHADRISGVNHSYKIKAFTLVDTVKVYSNDSAVVTNKAIPIIPLSPKAVFANYTSVTVSYTAVDGASGYEIYRSTTAAGVYVLVTSPTGTSYTNTGLAFNTTYYYKVRAFTLVDTVKVYGNYTAVVSAKTTLNTPVITPISSGYDRITVSWPAVTGISGYEVYQSTSSAGVYTLLISTAATSYTKTALLTNTNYFYKVRAYRLVGTVRVYSSYSTIQSARPVPAVPVATASSASYNSLKVAWPAIAGATGYEVSYSKIFDGIYTILPVQAATSYTLAGQTTNELVYFKVRAYRLVGTLKVFGNSSSIVSAKPIPSTPVLTVASDNYNRLKISWAAIAGASGYELYVLNPTSGLYELLNEGTALLYLHADRISGVNHSYKIKAFTLVDTVKVYSNDSTVVTNKAIPSVPALPKAVYTNYTSITVSYTAVDGASGYEIYRSTTAAGVYVLVTSPTGTSYTNTGLAFNTTYYYKVRAFTWVGAVKVYGNYTAVVSAKTTLNTPVATAVSASYNSIRISWPAIAGITRYELYRASSAAGVYTLLASLTTPTYTHAALATNTTYYYKVRAYRLVGIVKVYSSYSGVVNARPVPATPIVSAANVNYNSVKASWAAIGGATGYEVSYAKIIDGIYTALPVQAAASYTLTGQTTNEPVYFKVRAYRLVGTVKVFGLASSIVSATPYPAAPVISAVPNIDKVTLTWLAIPGITKYTIYHKEDGAVDYTLLGETTGLTYVHESLTLNSIHNYKVVGSLMVDTTELLTSDSNTLLVTVAAPAVSGLTAVSTAYDTINLRWNASVGATGYEVSMATSSAGVYTPLLETDQLSFVKTGLSFNTTYYFKVRPFTLDGATKIYGLSASIVSAKTTLGTPLVTSKSLSATSINLTWLAIPGASGYEVYRSTTLTGTAVLQSTLTASTYTKTVLIKGTVYYYKVRAYRLVGTVKVYGAFSTNKYVRVGY